MSSNESAPITCGSNVKFTQMTNNCQNVFIEGLRFNANAFLLLSTGIAVLFLQTGFACLEAGYTRSKNSTNVFLKTIANAFVAAVAFWIFGFPLAYGDASEWSGTFFLGRYFWCSYNMPDSMYAMWYFQFAFVSVSSIMVSGATTGRCSFVGFLIYTFLSTAFLYPVIIHWAWSEKGWLKAGETYVIDGTSTKIGYIDYAGSGVVHVAGGVASLVATVTIGARLGRFGEVRRSAERPVGMSGHAASYLGLGCFILFFGLLAYNCGAQQSLSQPGDADSVARAVKSAALAASFGCVAALLLGRLPLLQGYWCVPTLTGGTLAAMAAVCAGSRTFPPWAAAVVGLVAAFVYVLGAKLLTALRVDDPIGTVAAHFGGGIWGVIAAALFHRESGLFFTWNRRSGLQLAWQLTGLVAIILWIAVPSLVIFAILSYFNLWRVNVLSELRGLDWAFRHEPAYPAVAYGSGWTLHLPTDNLAMSLKQGRKVSATYGDLPNKRPSSRYGESSVKVSGSDSATS